MKFVNALLHDINEIVKNLRNRPKSMSCPNEWDFSTQQSPYNNPTFMPRCWTATIKKAKPIRLCF